MPEFDTAFKETCITSKNQKKKKKQIYIVLGENSFKQVLCSTQRSTLRIKVKIVKYAQYLKNSTAASL